MVLLQQIILYFQNHHNQSNYKDLYQHHYGRESSIHHAHVHDYENAHDYDHENNNHHAHVHARDYDRVRVHDHESAHERDHENNNHHAHVNVHKHPNPYFYVNLLIIVYYNDWNLYI